MSQPNQQPLAGLMASLRVAGGLFGISVKTLVDVSQGRLSIRQCDDYIRWWCGDVVTATGMDVRIAGLHHFPKDGRLVVMSNHQSHYDIPVLFYAISPRLRMVTKQELFRFPVWGKAMLKAGFIALDRNNREAAIASLKSAGNQLDTGIPVWIAPEGTRSKDGNLLPFKKGGFMMARDLDAQILPVAVSGTRDALPRDQVFTRLGQAVGVAVGEPIATKGKSRDELMSQTRKVLAELKEQADGLRRSAS